MLYYLSYVYQHFDWPKPWFSKPSNCKTRVETCWFSFTSSPGGLLYLTATGLTAWKPSRSFRRLGMRGRCPPQETLHDQCLGVLRWWGWARGYGMIWLWDTMGYGLWGELCLANFGGIPTFDHITHVFSGIFQEQMMESRTVWGLRNEQGDVQMI